MQILKILLLVVGGCFFVRSEAQTVTTTDSVKATINRFFEGMKRHDTTMIRGSLAPEVIFQTIARNKKGETLVRTEGVGEFLKFIAEHTEDNLDEQIEFEMVKIDGNLASVWTPYRFLLNGKLSHCGANSFQLVRLAQGWQIQYIIDTRRKNCN
jgi:hypothetical protein